MAKFIVVESGAKTRTISHFLQGEYKVVACGGHILDLPNDELAVDVHHGFLMKPAPIVEGGRDKLDAIRRKLEDADEVLLATDPDREGEAIAADLAERAVPSGVPTKRITFNAIVYHAVKEALNNAREIDWGRVHAQRARRALDRLIGFILSPVVQHDPDGPRASSVGRVQSPALALIVDREREIAGFVRRRFWSVGCRLAKGDVVMNADAEGDWDDFDAALAVVQDLVNARVAVVETLESNPHDEQSPPPPYATDTLQEEADSLLGFAPERTMKLAQQLYEGVEVGGTTRALITYMRTDSTRVSPTAISYAKQAISRRADELGQPWSSELYRGRPWAPDGGQDAHEAIRPTEPHDPSVWPEALESLEPDLRKLYGLIYWRFLASQMSPAVYLTTNARLSAGGRTLSASGSKLARAGYLIALRNVRPDYGRRDVPILDLELGAELTIERAWPEPQETRPPARFREGALVRELKRRGIGRPSTYGDTLAKLKQHRYAENIRGRLRPTERGTRLVVYLRDRYANAIDYDYTAGMEASLDQIETNQLTYEQFLGREFAWLREPYTRASQADWLDGNQPTLNQVEFLRRLAADADVTVPPEVFEDAAEVGQWIERLLVSAPVLSLGTVHESSAGDTPVWRLVANFSGRWPDEEFAVVKQHMKKLIRGTNGRPPFFQLQAIDRARVEQSRRELVERYQDGTRGIHLRPEDL